MNLSPSAGWRLRQHKSDVCIAVLVPDVARPGLARLCPSERRLGAVAAALACDCYQDLQATGRNLQSHQTAILGEVSNWCTKGDHSSMLDAAAAAMQGQA